MKGIYRTLEKSLLKYGTGASEDVDLSQCHDIVRGGVIDINMHGLAAIASYIHESDKVTVCRLKDRFTTPSKSGWADMMLNFYFNAGPSKHVCELQLIHVKMLSQRTTQEGHHAYNVFRVLCVCVCGGGE